MDAALAEPGSDASSGSESVPGESVLLIQGDDLGPQSVWYRWWLDEPDAEPRVWTVDRDDLAPLLEELAEALPIRRPGETIGATIERAMTGALAEPRREKDLMVRLGRALLPSDLASELYERRWNRGRSIVIRLAPAPSTIRVPWEILAVPGYSRREGTRAVRLIEFAAVAGDVPAAFHAGRAILPQPRRAPRDDAPREVIRIIDPALGVDGTRLFTDGQHRDLAVDGEPFPPGSAVDAASLGERLRATRRPAALLFVGHVTGSSTRAGATALQLTPVSGPTARGVPPSAAKGRLSASDLVLGTTADETRQPRIGARIWPMPPRVAFVACDSGGDLGRQEPFGLVIAALNSGAEFALGTRWVLLADRAFRSDDRLAEGDPEPLLGLARLAERVLTAADPLHALEDELREALFRWEDEEGEPGPAQVARSPLVWAALSATVAPARPVEPAAD